MRRALTISMTLLAALFCISCGQQPEAVDLGETSVQLYNFRKLINTPEGYAAHHEEIFSTLAEQGYTSVEAANYHDGLFYGVTPEQYRADVEAAGLKPLSSHTSFYVPEEMATKDFTQTLAWWDEAIQAHKAAGMQYIVWPSYRMPETLDELKTFCDLLNEIGRRCAAEGITFGYHSHSHEFVQIEDQTAYDFMLQNTDPDYVFFQMDVYWAVMGKVSPVDYFHAYPGRFKLLHIKDDMDLGQSGMVGFDAIFRSLDVAGTVGIVVEEEAFPTEDWAASMQSNIDYLRWVKTTVSREPKAKVGTDWNMEMTAQLYNLRKIIGSAEGYAANHEEVFRTLKEQGYTAVETSGTAYADGLIYGVSPEQFKADVEAAGLKVLSGHPCNGVTDEELDTGDFTERLAWWDRCIADHKTAGMTYIEWPYMRKPKDLNQLQNFCTLLNEIGRRCADQGIKFGYHSHNHEFSNVDGEVMMDYMLQNTDPDLVFYQMDIYWAVVGKASPVEYFHKYPGRFKMLHIKDNYEIGQSGMVGFDAIFRNFDLAGTEQIAIEEEVFSSDDWKACMQTNIDYIKWLGRVLK